MLESAIMRERFEQFVKNLTSALGHCVQEELEVLPEATLALIGILVLCMFWVAGVVVYDLILDPHFTKASLDAVSINPDRWIPR